MHLRAFDARVSFCYSPSSTAFFSFFCQQKARQKAVLTNTTENISTDKTNRRYVLGHVHGVGVQSLVIDKRPTVTQIFLLWTECKQKQSQPSILCYISLSRCCLSLLSFAGLARSKEKNLHNALKFSCTAKLFQSQTVQSIPCLRVSRGLISQCKSCQIFVSIVHFPYIKAVDEKNVYKSEENLSASFRGAVIFARRGNQRL